MLKVYIAEDDDVIRGGIKAIIRKNISDCEIVGESADGEEALNSILELTPDLLITDIKMPVMDGIELIKSLRKRNINIKVIVLSGFDEYNYLRESLKNGVLDYLLKPLENNELIQLLNRIKQELQFEMDRMKEVQLLSLRMEQGMDILKEKFLKELLKGRDILGISMNSNELKSFNSGQYVLIIFSLDYIQDTENCSFEASPFIIMEKNIENVLSEEFGSSLFLKAEDWETVVTLLKDNSENVEMFKQKVDSILELIKQKIESSAKQTVTIGVSNLFTDIDRTIYAYHQSLFAIERRFYEGGNKIYFYEAEKACYNFIDEKPLVIQFENLVNGIELGQIKKVNKAWEDIFEILVKQYIQPASFKEEVRSIIEKVALMVPEFKLILKEYINCKLDLVEQINYTDTLVGVREIINVSFNRMVIRLNIERAEKSKKVIGIAIEYIMRNYHSHISLKLVAEHVFLNPSYLSDLFKRETGKNFIDFLTETRINNAKKLLSDPTIKVYEAGIKVGYSDSTTFLRAFKKIVGASPAEYRNIIKR